MEWIIPGTVLPAQREAAATIDTQFNAMFLGGGVMLGQVSAITGLEPYTVQNWVKRGFLPNPVNKRYSCSQFCRIVTINMLRSAMTMDKICSLLTYVNGELDDESDDLIDDTVLYFMFLRLAARARHIGGTESWDTAIADILKDYVEPVPGAKKRIDQVLRIMLTAWIGVRTIQKAEQMLLELKED